MLVDRIKRYQSQIIAIVLWITAGISANLYMRLNNITSIEFVDEISHLLSDNWYGVVLYIILYFLRPFTFFPGTPITIAAGYLYGVWWGFLYAMIGGLLSTLIPYATGRWFSDGERLNKMMADDSSTIILLIRKMREHPFQTTLATRFLYLPYDLVNFVAGSLHINFLSFITATIIGNLVNVFLMVSVGASIKTSLTDGEFQIDYRLFAISAVIWLLSSLISRYFKRQQQELETT